MTKLIAFLLSVLFPQDLQPSELEICDRLEAMAVRKIEADRRRMYA